MKRSGFKRPEMKPAKQTTSIARAKPVAVASTVARLTVAVPKQVPMRSPEYLRLVAGLPCFICGRIGRSQAAHPNTNKGMGTKTDDRRVFPLCADEPMRPGCHSQMDQGAAFTKMDRRELEELAGEQTRQEIIEAGLWPHDLQRWE